MEQQAHESQPAILVAGGTGRLGTEIVRLLTRHGLALRVLTRDRVRARSLEAPHVEIVVGDVRDSRAVERAAAGVRTVVSAVHGFAGVGATSPEAVDWRGNLNLIRAATAGGAEHMVLVSVQGAAADHPMELFRMKYRAEAALRESALAWTILRPTAFMETWATLIGEPLLRTGKTVIFGRGHNPINFVSVSDVARFAELAVVDPALRGAVVEIGGPENLSLRQVVDVFAREGGRRGTARHVPLPVMRLASVLMRPINPVIARQIRAGIVMDTVDMSFDARDRSQRYPAIPITTLAEVVRRDHRPA
jgi:NADH dehydrogenase